MSDNVVIGSANGVTVSSEEVTTLNGSTVTAQQVQRVISGYQTANSTVVDGVGLAHRLDAVNDNITTYPLGHSYTNITTNATTTVKTGSGTLIGINVNNPSALTVANLTLTIYDNTAGSGTKLGTIIVPFGTTTANPFRITFSSAFSTGLTIVTAGPTVTADLTIEYR